MQTMHRLRLGASLDSYRRMKRLSEKDVEEEQTFHEYGTISYAIALEMVISYSLYKTLSLNGEFEY